MFTREWTIPAALGVLLLIVCGTLGYFTWSLMPPAQATRDTFGATYRLTHDHGQPLTE